MLRFEVGTARILSLPAFESLIAPVNGATMASASPLRTEAFRPLIPFGR